MQADHQSLLVDYLAQAKIVPFVGSGLSCNVKLPSWRQVIKVMSDEIGERKDEDLFDTAQRFQELCGRDRLIELLVQQLSLHLVDIDRLDIHTILVSFPFSDIFTTNQDLVLELVLADLNIPYTVIRNHSDLRKVKSFLFPRLVKFHGDLMEKDEIIFTRQDVNDRLKAPHPFDIYLQGRLIENAVLFIGYGLKDPNVEAVWKRVQLHSAADCQPVGFRMLHNWDQTEIDRMSSLGIHPVVVPIDDFGNPVELLEWFQGVYAKVKSNFCQASLEYLFHGRLAPAPVLTRGELGMVKNELLLGKPPDDLLKQATYYKRIPRTLEEEVEKLLLDHIQNLVELTFVWEVAFKNRMDKLGAHVFTEMFRRVGVTRDQMSDNCRNVTTIGRNFDGWAMNILMNHLKSLEGVSNTEKLHHHLRRVFDIIEHSGYSTEIGKKDWQALEELKRFYEIRFPGLSLQSRCRLGLRNAEERINEGFRRDRVLVSDSEN
ncbi:MAG: SIR2 family protein [Desulfomonilaceae bacterium]